MADVEVPNPEDVQPLAKDRFTKIVALTVACYAVLLAVASLGGNNATKDTNLNQQEASNQWAYYQAKAGREYQSRIARMRLELDLEMFPPEQRAEAEKRLAEFAAEEERYRTEKEPIMKRAKECEEARDLNKRKDPYFDYAEVLLQIAIVLASVSMLSGARLVFLMSLLLAFGGAFLTLNGYLLFAKVPFLKGS